MTYDNMRAAGALVFIGGTEFLGYCLHLRRPSAHRSLQTGKKAVHLLFGVMGLFSLSSLVLLSAEYSFGLGQQFYLGVGPGGMERMIAYPMLLWDVAFGGYLMASHQQSARTRPG